MKRRKKSNLPKLILLIILAIGFVVLGDTYAAWSKQQSVHMYLNTGSFTMLFKEDGIYKTEIYRDNQVVDSDINIITDISDRRKAIVSIDAFILDELSVDNTYLKISMPIENIVEGYHEGVLEYEPDFNDDNIAETVDMSIKEVLLSYDGRGYEYPKSMFKDKLSFDLYRSVKRDDDVLYCIIYLRLSDESRNSLVETPGTVELSIDELADMPSKVIDAKENGFVVFYEGELDFVLDQKEAQQEE